MAGTHPTCVPKSSSFFLAEQTPGINAHKINSARSADEQGGGQDFSKCVSRIAATLDCVLNLDCNPFYFENRHLSFLALTSYVESTTDEYPLVGLTYCLEAGVIRWYGTPSSPSSPLHLRQNTVLSPSDREQLASWEPMTDDKMVLLAIEVGLMGNVDAPLDEEPDFLAIAVNPRGFVYRWNGSDHIYLSHVQTLAGADQELFHDRRTPGKELWEKHKFISPSPTENTIYGREPAPGVALMDCILPEFPTTLTEWSHRVIPPTPDPRADPESEFSAEAAAFVQQHFGVDVSTVDPKEANLARLINAKYGTTAPFDPRKAVNALRAAVATNPGATRIRPSALAAGPTHDQPVTRKPPGVPDR